ncbi:hypothetical protein IFM89_022731 [Coptis chinensis]|uniref:ARID domain-containing protein n=1 Tax=Coptis chinensis TaxID=261450 RepID=A0A835IC74_9MAGN|nr:hypothetical protein IFM89_022731 [Coptis chinensis]
MAGWSILSNGSVLDYLEILQKLQNHGFCLDLDMDSLKMNSNDCGSKDGKLRYLFDHILSVFLKNISVTDCFRPLPVMLGDGQCVDLFKLFWVVREKGGLDFVSKNGLWGCVAEEIGLSLGVASSVKLFYFKYLDILDRWLRSFEGVKGGIGVRECDRNMGVLETHYKDILCDIPNGSRIVEEVPEKVVLMNNDIQVSVSPSSSDYNRNEVIGVLEKGGVDKRVVDDDEDVVILDKSAVDDKVFSRKRKREALSGMLHWLTGIAKSSCDTTRMKLIDASKQECGGQEFQSWALLARNAMFQNITFDFSEENENPIGQKKQKIHPSMYEDQVIVDHLSTDRIKCSPRITSQRNGHPFLESPDLDHQSLNPCDEDEPRQRIPLGPLYQAEVPAWTGVAYKRDPKWLGTLQWPLITDEQNLLAEKYPIGKGRQDSCTCRVPGSVECVRFHTAEEKVRLKSELGLAFYSWKFHHMGEEVSLSWTVGEEKKFKTIVRSNPPSMEKDFWDQLTKCFRSKSWKSLVSYYFNVFVLRRRTYQNRVTPSDIDSDDDESEFGSLSNGYRHEAVKVRGFKSISCAQNQQCIGLS